MTTKALRKQLVAAIAMVLVAAVALGSSTYAWFAMNTQVTATGMQVQAKAESGLLISEVQETSGTWDSSATGGTSSPFKLIPMSTADGSNWFHSNSKLTSSAASSSSSANSANLIAAGYETPTLADNAVSAVDQTNCLRTLKYKDVDGTTGYNDAVDQGAYVKYTFYLKSSSGAITCASTNPGDQYVEITSIDIGGLTGKSLDAAFRVGVKVNSTFYIYAPISDSTNSYYVGTAHTAVTTQALATGSAELTADGTAEYDTISDLATLPAFTAQGTPAEIYIWLEGEDANCFSDNITASLDSVTVQVNFSLKTVTATP